MYPSQLPYLPTSGMSPMYMQMPGNYPANYCMPMLGTVNNLGMYGGNIPMGVNNYVQQTPTVSTASISDETKEPNRDNVSTSPQLPEPNANNAPEAGDERAEYIEELNRERESLDQCKEKESSHVRRLIEREISMVQSGHIQPSSSLENKLVDVYREKPIRLVVKVAVPVKEHPKFNFVGKLLGPKGNSLKRMQEETLTKMAVLGKGSMRDKVKEEEMRLSKDPKYHHLNEDLHVEITAFAPPAEAHARLSYALTEVRKYLIPDSNDHIRQLQMKELEILSNSEKMISDPSQLQLLKTVSPLHAMQPLLVPSSTYLSSPHLSLLPTPPLDTSPTITAPPTKYETDPTQDQYSPDRHLKISVRESDNKRTDRRRELQPY